MPAPTTSSYAFHPGGVNVLFGDGSVRVIKSTISLRTMLLLAARGDGQVADSSQY